MSSARKAERFPRPLSIEPLAPYMATLARWFERTDVRLALVAALGLRLVASTFAALVVLVLHDPYIHVTKDVLARGTAMNVYTLPIPLTGPEAYLTGPWLHWDANHLIGIAESGYEHKDATAFMPLYPVLVRIGSVFALGNTVVSALLVSTVSIFFAFLFLYRLTLRFTHSPRVAAMTVAVAAVLPISFFFVAPYSEPLYLALSLGCIWQALELRWGSALLLAVLAALTRQQGLVLGALVLPGIWSDARDVVVDGAGTVMRRLRGFFAVASQNLLFLLAPFAAYVAWVFVLQFILGRGAPVQLLTAQHGWNQHFAFPGLAVLNDLASIVRGPSDALQHYFSLPLDTAASILALIGLIVTRRKLPQSVWLYLAACWCIALVKVDFFGNTTSAARYLLALLPLCVVPAQWLERARPPARILLFGAFAYLWCFYFGEWLLWSWVS